MNKDDFFRELYQPLSSLQEEEREEILYDFHEHFELGLAEGKAEEAICEELGDPRVIAKDLLREYRITKAEQERSFKHIFQAVFATLSLSLLNMILVLGPALAVIAVYAALCITALTLTSTPILLLGSTLFHEVSQFWLSIFISLIACGLGLLLAAGVYYLGIILYNGLLRYIKFNIAIIKGGKV